MKKLSLLAALAAPLAFAAPAQAQDGSRMIQQMQAADSNKDGAVSRNELLAYRSTQFDRIDRNSDGVISDADMPRFQRIREKMEARIAGFDVNKDGRVTRAEFTNGPTTAFDMADANKDGVVTKAEMESLRAMIDERRNQ